MNTNDYLVYETQTNKFYIFNVNNDLDTVSELQNMIGHGGFEFLPLEDNHNILASITITNH